MNKSIGQSITKISIQYHKGSYWKKSDNSELLVIFPKRDSIGKFEYYKILKTIDKKYSTKDTAVYITDSTMKIKYNSIDSSILKKLYIEITDSTKEYRSRKEFEWIFQKLTRKHLKSFVPQESFEKRYGKYYEHNRKKLDKYDIEGILSLDLVDTFIQQMMDQKKCFIMTTDVCNNLSIVITTDSNEYMLYEDFITGPGQPYTFVEKKQNDSTKLVKKVNPTINYLLYQITKDYKQFSLYLNVENILNDYINWYLKNASIAKYKIMKQLKMK